MSRPQGASRICLITPGHLATNPRLVKEADALSGAGYRVSVICADYLGWARDADRAFEGRPWTVAARLPFGPDAPTPVRLRQVAVQRLARALFGAGATAPGLDAAAWHPVAPDLIQAARRTPADLYIAHYPAALPAAALAARSHGAAYAFDAEDFHPGDPPPDPAHDGLRRLIEAIERRWLPGARYLTAASPGIGRSYAEQYGLAPPETVLNVFPLSHAPSQATPAGTAQPGPSLYWFSQTIGPDRGLECAVEAVGLAATRPHLHLRGAVSDAYRRRLLALAEQCGAADRVHFLEIAAPADMERLAAGYDLGLAAETANTENHKLALANKIFSYLLAGTPVLASDIPAHRELANAHPGALRLFPVDDAPALAAALDVLLSDPAALAAARTEAFALGQTRFNWDREQERLIACVRSALGGGGGTGGATP